MENQYKKTFADLMVNKKLLYVHGFMSSGATHTAKILQEYMPQCTVIAPDLPIHPEEAMELLRKIQADERPDYLLLARQWEECTLKCFMAQTAFA